MRNYLIRRTLQLIPVFLGAILITFVILSLVSNPFAAMMENPKIRREDIQALIHAWGFDLPIYLRFFKWLGSVIKGNWGPSLLYPGYSAKEVILRALPITLQVMGLSTVLSVVVAIPLGIISAVRQYSRLDYGLTVFSFFGMSMPTFWFGLMMMIVFSVWLKRPSGLPLLPPGGIQTPGIESAALMPRVLDRVQYLLMPVIVLAMFSVGYWVRYQRSFMLEVLHQDYLRTARAKGLEERKVIYKHALRNALIPIITLVALSIPGIVSGAAITEYVFNIPGMGQLLLQSEIKSDYPTAMLILILFTFLVIISNLIADIVYSLVDPRIRYT
jgi:peptide/nickel transport system permease protein